MAIDVCVLEATDLYGEPTGTVMVGAFISPMTGETEAKEAVNAVVEYLGLGELLYEEIERDKRFRPYPSLIQERARD